MMGIVRRYFVEESIIMPSKNNVVWSLGGAYEFSVLPPTSRHFKTNNFDGVRQGSRVSRMRCDSTIKETPTVL
eukprot:scaffold192376_cov35-Attheya_sp.AAC.2